MRLQFYVKCSNNKRQLALPVCSGIFGGKGMKALEALSGTLAGPDGTLLRQDLEVMRELKAKIVECEKMMAADNAADPDAELLGSLPGVGLVLGALLACEIDGIARFAHPRKLVAYAGLAPTTYSSGEKTYHGRLLPQCNGWLRWAFVEAAWVAIGCDGYLGALYRHAREQAGHGFGTREGDFFEIRGGLPLRGIGAIQAVPPVSRAMRARLASLMPWNQGFPAFTNSSSDKTAS